MKTKIEVNLRGLTRFIDDQAKKEDLSHSLEDVQDAESWNISEGSNISYLLDQLLSRTQNLNKDCEQAESRLPVMKKGLGSVGTYLARIQENIKFNEVQTSEKALMLRGLPITAIDLQRSLRTNISNVDKNLTDLESVINVLKAKLSRSGTSAKPSIPGIIESISKITEMALKKGRQVEQIANRVAERRAVKGGTKALANYEHVTRDSIMSDVDFVNVNSRRKMNSAIADAVRGQSKESVLRNATMKRTRML